MQHAARKGEKARDDSELGITSCKNGGATFVAHVTGSEPEQKQERWTCEGFLFARRVAGATKVAGLTAREL